MKPITISSVKPKMPTYGQLIKEMKEYARGMEPYKKRFYKFISENSCSDIPMVPSHHITPETIYSANGDVIKTIPVRVSTYNLDFPSFPSSPDSQNKSNDVLDSIEGAPYRAEIYNYQDDIDYRTFVIPDAYMENPSAWEEEVLRLIEIRESIADAVIKAVFPNAPKEAKKESLYTFDINAPTLNMEKSTERILIRLNPEFLPKEGEPYYQALYGANSLFVTLATGEVSTLSEIIPGAIPSYTGIEKVGF